MALSSYFADLHIHIGRDMFNKPVKITGAKSLTLSHILIEASRHKGMDLVGVIDSHVPAVQSELRELIADHGAWPLQDGGIQYERTTLILGSEVEVYDSLCQGPIHVLCFFPDLESMKGFTEWLKERVTNIHLSSQRYYGTAKQLQDKVKELSGLFIPAHVFTPFKSLYGKGVKQSLTEILDPDLIDGIELGLSADTKMADQIEELHPFSFLSNSDAHSLAKIGREYQKIRMEAPSFQELKWALQQLNGRRIEANYGMNPLLGKYHETVCSDCFHPVDEGHVCGNCGSEKWIKGVADRIRELANATNFPSRPPYIHQVPLEYLPTLGPKTLHKLLDAFGTEMHILHHTSKQALEKVVSDKLAEAIIAMREGKLKAVAGGGGRYGKIKLP
ncbi:TIGR00375 family protein [Sediminibacillus dalangtanensis]|uniref:TIGR00375 family protein n=1 Tax=Sediminibacillus dalangtanensis TaxID=2729421 RepID=A0ABX7VS05_9BACI|nr:endonuclease Q family protein [Sediminibacillus dalangtanensis]QTM99722.1 TIGR00375 family protein [Sediminibacillus dalangtanensis]